MAVELLCRFRFSRFPCSTVPFLFIQVLPQELPARRHNSEQWVPMARGPAALPYSHTYAPVQTHEAHALLL